MKCQNTACGSTDTQLCSLAYEQGTTHSKTSGTATWSDGSGDSSTYEANTVSRTAFAERAAPPVSGVGQGIGATLTFLFVGFLAYDFVPTSVHVVFAILILGAAAYTVMRIVNFPKHLRQHAAWERSWICKRCGTISTPDGQPA
jgi:hypothetical protein